MSKTVFNFCAGPSTLPAAVRQKIADEWFNWNDTGVSVTEISHRSVPFMQMLKETESTLRELMQIPKNYRVLFLPAGAQGQFALVPMNLLGKNNKADYLTYGLWGQLAVNEAKRYGDIKDIVIRSENSPCQLLSYQEKIRSDAMYVHYCSNETVDGIKMSMPKVVQPLVADMSSDILSQPIDVEKHGVIYAGAQKNMGVSGITVVIVRDDWLDQAMELTPSVLSYRKQADTHSLYNTQNNFACYVLHLVSNWVKEQGGLAAMQKLNQRKAKKLYDVIDASDFYFNSVASDCRSVMNVVFNLKNLVLESVFLAEAEKEGLVALKGHKAVGGIRASIYNAMPEEGVDRLVEFMQAFASKHS